MLYTYLDELEDVYYIYVDDKEVQTSIRKASGSENAEAGGYYCNPDKTVVYSEVKADAGTFAEELFHAFQYRLYGNAKETQIGTYVSRTACMVV